MHCQAHSCNLKYCRSFSNYWYPYAIYYQASSPLKTKRTLCEFISNNKKLSNKEIIIQIKVITKADFAKATKLDKLYMPGLASLLMELMRINEVNELFERAEHLKGLTFIDKVLQIIGITVECNESDLKNIPEKGAFIAIANHPYGGIEGLVLLKILCTVRPDAKLMANFLLKKIPNLSDYFIAVIPN